MKKVYRVTNWGPVELSAANIADKSHWLVKALDHCLTLMDIGNFSFTYLSTSTMTLTTQYGSGVVRVPILERLINTSDYIIFIDTENKELLACASLDGTQTSRTADAKNSYNGQYVRGMTNSAITTGHLAISGYCLSIKFKNNEMIFSSYTTNAEWASGSKINRPTNNCVGIVLPDNFEALYKPLAPVSIKCQRAPIYRNFTDLYNITESSTGSCRFDGEYFTSIYVTDKFYLGALKSSDNKRWYYGGYLFDVDDATDIGIIQTTI